MAVSRCPHCQQLLLPDEALAPACPICGGALPAAAAPVEAAAPVPAPVAPPPPPRPRTPWALWAAVVLLALSNGAMLAWMLWPHAAPQPNAAPLASLVDAGRPPEPAPAAATENHGTDSQKAETPAPAPKYVPLASAVDEAVKPAAPVPPPAVPMPPAPMPNPPAAPAGAARPAFPPPPWLEGLANLDELRGRIEWNAAGDVVALHLGDSDLSDNELCLLQPFDSLRELNLDRTRVTEKGLVLLQRLKELRTLSLRGIAVSDAGVAALQKALPDLKIIR